MINKTEIGMYLYSMFNPIFLFNNEFIQNLLFFKFLDYYSDHIFKLLRYILLFRYACVDTNF